MHGVLIDSLQEKVFCSNHPKEEGAKYREKTKALGYKYIALNSKYRKYIIIDIDVEQSPFLWEHRNLPPPTLITISPNSGKCHCLYGLKTPVIFTENGRTKPQDFFKAVEFSLTKALSGDMSYNHLLTKNPYHEAWRTINHNVYYELNDFREWMDISKYKERIKTVVDEDGRNCTLFKRLTLLARVEVRNAASEEHWFGQVLHMGEDLNKAFQEPLPFGEIKTIARSVAKYAWKRRFEIGPDKTGILQLPSDMPLDDKQRQGAIYTHKVRSASTLEKIKIGYETLRNQHRNPTQRAVADEVKMSIDTVKRYWNLVSPI